MSSEITPATQVLEEGGPTVQFLRFALGVDSYAVGIPSVREILEVSHLTPLPLMPAFVRGVMNLRGAVVPVIDLGARLGLAPAVLGRRTCVVMVDVPRANAEPRPMGVLVDAVHEVFETTPGNPEKVPRMGASIDVAFIQSMLRARERTIVEINLAQVLDPAELTELITAPTLQ
jgi:purine-binding chemotaxis protein CheW